MEQTSSSDLGSKDVCDIILTCAKAGVSVLKFGSLHVEFGRIAAPALSHDLDTTESKLHEPDLASIPVTAITEEDKKTIRETLRLEEIHLRDDQISLAVIEDPTLAEELITGELQGENGVIEDGGNS